jgi:hypothetical protein
LYQSPHLVLYHKQHTSARLRFLRHAHGGICAAGPMPADTRIETVVGAGAQVGAGASLSTHPGMLLRAAEAALGLPRGCIEADGGFRCRVVVEGNGADVHLAHFCDIDPPLDAAAAAGAEFIDLTAARGLPRVELELLRLAYEHVLG